MTRPKEPVRPAASKAKMPGKAFDAWLENGLHQLYDGVVSEPVPEALLRLIEGDRNK